MISEELKPCPFCSSEAEITKWHEGYFVECKEQRCGGTIGAYKTEEEAIEAWNTRAERTSYCAVPEGYLVVPAPDKTVTPISIASGRFDITDFVDTYSRVLEKHVQDEIVTKSLENCGYVKKRTCRYEHIEGTWYKTSCGERYDGVVPPNYCPNCGAKVVE